jgi:hypothetical protein
MLGKLTLKAFYPEGMDSKQLHKLERTGDTVRSILKDVQGLSPCCLKD